MYRLRPLQIVLDHRGKEVEFTVADENDPTGKTKKPAPESIDGKMPLRHLLEQALGDDPLTFSPTGQPNPPAQVDIADRRRRSRLQTEMWAQKDEWEVTKGDGEYIVQRANVLLNTAAFGIVDRAWDKAIQEFENSQDAEKAERDASTGGTDSEEPLAE